MVKTTTLKETRVAYSLSLDKADLTQGPLMVEHEGQLVAALVPITEYRQFQAWREKHVPPSSDPDDEWERGRQVFQQMRSELLRTHKGQFVAVLRGQVVDADTEIGTLAKRVYAKFGHRPIYMQKVTKQPRVARISSPRVVR